MNSVQSIARETRRGLFGATAPARAWEKTIADFQEARETLSRTALELESIPPDVDDVARRAAWESMLNSIHNQMSLMDSTASGILATANIANGLESFFPGFEGISASGVLGLNTVAAPAAIATLRAMTGAAHSIVNRARNLLGAPTPPPGLSGFTPWGSLGGDIWEWWHAEQVQREFEAIGQEPPSIEEIREGALTDIGKRVSEGARSVFSGIQTVAIAGTVIAVVIFMGRRK